MNIWQIFKLDLLEDEASYQKTFIYFLLIILFYPPQDSIFSKTKALTNFIPSIYNTCS